MKKQIGFTLVELLIVISLIAILSVGVLATINPIEQRNKAADANTSNDSGEVLNALERYYTNQSNYPWMVVDSSILVDDAYYLRSNVVGLGLCGAADTSTDGALTVCDTYDTPGSLISSDELKSSFLQKKYGLTSSETGYNANNLLYVVKESSTENNSLYVCYIPKAKSNRTSSNSLKKLAINAAGLPTGIVDAVTTGTGADFDSTGKPIAAWDFLAPATSLFKCVP